MNEQLQALLARATHYRPMLPSGVSSEPWLRIIRPFSLEGVVVDRIVSRDRGEYDVLYRRADDPWRMWLRVAPREQLRLREEDVPLPIPPPVCVPELPPVAEVPEPTFQLRSPIPADRPRQQRLF